MINLSLHTQPIVPLEAECISPDHIHKLNIKEIEKLSVLHGNQTAKLADFFNVAGEPDQHIQISGDLSMVKHIGSQMSLGNILIEGDIGQHLGALMTGGEIKVIGNAGDWVGAELLGGRIIIEGNAGHMLGSAYRGNSVGVQGGEIIVTGDVKNEVGNGMRRGNIIIGGNSGDFTGVNMLGGSIIVLQQMGIRSGASMKRGTIISGQCAQMLPTFSFSCVYHPNYLRHYFMFMRKVGINVDDALFNGTYERWCGDAIELNRGEILLYKP